MGGAKLAARFRLCPRFGGQRTTDLREREGLASPRSRVMTDAVYAAWRRILSPERRIASLLEPTRYRCGPIAPIARGLETRSPLRLPYVLADEREAMARLARRLLLPIAITGHRVSGRRGWKTGAALGKGSTDRSHRMPGKHNEEKDLDEIQ